jgi:nucleotide-binding universal stress UspA family protein
MNGPARATQHILLPTDFGAPAQNALEVAVTLAEKLGADLTLLHSVWIPATLYPYADGLYLPIDAWNAAARRALDEALADLKKRYPRSEGLLTTHDPAQAILEVAKSRHADLIVMGTHGRHGLSRARHSAPSHRGRVG